MMYHRVLLVGMFTVSAPVGLNAAVDYERDIQPILREHCLACHGADLAESKLRLDSPLAALRGGNSGEQVIVPGKSGGSYLIELLTSQDATQRMPLDADPLSDRQIQLLKDWIDDAAVWQPLAEELAAQTIEHWSFQPLSRPVVPAIQAANPIDAFVTAKLEPAGLKMSERAERRRLIRRLYLVLHGLPPTPQQVSRFLADERENAWELLVNEVLDSPHYGERWATHWLDLVRFGETHGFETNRERPHAWHYRDWVIRAFNDDKPYDQFIIEQLAGDAVGAHVATGFLVAGPYDVVKGQDKLLRLVQRQDELADIINTTGTAFLGLTLGCARCHNHKFDPISQADYYSMQAVFAGVQHADRALPPRQETQQQLAELDREISVLKHGLARYIRPPDSPGGRPPVQPEMNVEQFPAVAASKVRFTINASSSGEPCIDELEIFAGKDNVGLASAGAKATSSGDFVHPLHKLAHINDGRYGNARSWISSRRTGGWVQIELPAVTRIDRIVWARDREGRYRDRLPVDYQIDVSIDGQDWQRVASSVDRAKTATKTPVIEYDFSKLPQPTAAAAQQQLARLQKLQQQRETLAKPTLAYAGRFVQPGATHRLYRGEPTSPREQVPPGAIQSLATVKLPADSPEQARRLAIARWIANRDNPLTARVMVNRLWQQHFGSGLVDTPSDFGGNGTLPTHPQLLDWLAAEFVDSGWSIKHMHRLLLTSHTWQQDSRSHPQGLQVDAGSRLLWRFPPRRLEAEGIRDCLLAVTGKLDRRMGGTGFSAFQVEQENVRHYFPKQDYGPQDWRRMIYMTKVRQERDSVFGLFDCPDCSQVVPTRSRSTTPLQALNLLNSRFVMQQSGFLVERLQQEADTTEARISRAYELCFSRPPSAEEIQFAGEFIETTGWLQFARAVLNTNEFVFIP